MLAAAQGIHEALLRHQQLMEQIDQNIEDFTSMITAAKEQYIGRMMDAKDQAKVRCGMAYMSTKMHLVILFVRKA
jgi:hypothetical protein